MLQRRHTRTAIAATFAALALGAVAMCGQTRPAAPSAPATRAEASPDTALHRGPGTRGDGGVTPAPEAEPVEPVVAIRRD